LQKITPQPGIELGTSQLSPFFSLRVPLYKPYRNKRRSIALYVKTVFLRFDS